MVEERLTKIRAAKGNLMSVAPPYVKRKTPRLGTRNLYGVFVP